MQCEVFASTAGGEASARSNTLGVAAAPVVPVPGGPPTPTPSPMPKPSTLPQIVFSTSKVVFAKRVASVHIACTPAATCVGTVQLTEQVLVTRLRGKKVISRKRKTLVLAFGSFAVAEGHAATVVLHLTNVGKTRLALTKADICRASSWGRCAAAARRARRSSSARELAPSTRSSHAEAPHRTAVGAPARTAVAVGLVLGVGLAVGRVRCLLRRSVAHDAGGRA